MKYMTIAKLRELLDELEELMEDGENTRILVVHQASYPLQEEITGVWASDPPTDEDVEPDEEDYQNNVAYIVVDGHPRDLSPYGPRRAFMERIR